MSEPSESGRGVTTAAEMLVAANSLKGRLDDATNLLDIVDALESLNHAQRLSTLAMLHSIIGDTEGAQNTVHDAVKALETGAVHLSSLHQSVKRKVSALNAELKKMLDDAA